MIDYLTYYFQEALSQALCSSFCSSFPWLGGHTHPLGGVSLAPGMYGCRGSLNTTPHPYFGKGVVQRAYWASKVHRGTREGIGGFRCSGDNVRVLELWVSMGQCLFPHRRRRK